MLTRFFVAGEDAAHQAFVAGFLDAFDYPLARVALDPAGLPKGSGRTGDGKERMFADAGAAAQGLWSRRNHENSILVLLHDLGDEEIGALRRRVLARVAAEADVAPAFLAERTIVLLPQPETEGWIAAMLRVGYVPAHTNTEAVLKRQTFHFGKEAGQACRRGEQDRLPDPIRAFCEEVGRYTHGLRSR